MAVRETRLFTHSTCPDSPKVRAWLKMRNIPFVERALDHDPTAVEELQQTGMFVTPLLLSGSDRVIGYRPQRLQQIFGVDE